MPAISITLALLFILLSAFSGDGRPAPAIIDAAEDPQTFRADLARLEIPTR